LISTILCKGKLWWCHLSTISKSANSL